MSPTPIATRRSHALLLRLFPVICALPILLGIGCYLLIKTASSQDADVQQRARTYITRTLEQVENEIGHNIINYAKWGEAYKHLHLKVDRFWANEERNVGDIPYELYGYNGVFVLDPQDRTVYAVIDGQPTERTAAQWLEGDLTALLAATRQRPGETESLVRILSVGGVPALVAAATITPGASYGVTPGTGVPSVMLFVNVLDPATLAHLSDTYGLPTLQASRLPLPDHESLRPLDSPLLLNWQPPRPGAQLLRRTLPVFLAGVLLLGLVLALLIRHALNSARQLDQQFDALIASQAELSRSESRFRELAEAASDWLWESDAEGRIAYLSERFARITGHAPGSWLGRPLAELFSSETTRLADWLLDKARQLDERQVLRCHYRDRLGHSRVCEITARPLPKDAGFRGTASDITAAVNAQAEIEHLSQHDSLTGLANRLQLQHYLAAQLAQPSTPLTLLSLDLDRFKPINDSLGHAAGDRVLQEIARRLQASLRPGGLVARLGGDEFIVVLLGHLDVATVDQICARLVSAIGRPIPLEEQTVSVGTSIGIAQAPEQASQVEDLLRLADIALYQAKAAGRNGWCFHAPAMDAQLSQRRDLEQELRQALARDQVRLAYLPRRRTADGTLSGVEAQLHWAHPIRGTLPPEAFLPLAEETGLSAPLGLWLLDSACRAAAAWPAPLRLVISVSPRQFDDAKALVEAVAQALQTSGLAAERLELQLPEALLRVDGDPPLPQLQALNALGVRLSLADFGKGLGAFDALRQPLLEGISLDSQLIAHLDQRQADAAIAQALIGLGRTLGLRVAATGVETSGQLAWLKAQHCAEVQGPLFGHALFDRELAALLDTDLRAG
ncbi:EAL domain-containing protein [Pseudomonas sp. Snoq117.2]|uniref:bifunctional diguanylate cyclase/phosphodiesterase n=1 Tax=Pseudomonas sp. Snoq117.2 TaxID=1500302 RepID=UPI0008CF6684|nr:EAL domain-containing protein [Pseudomonas sp. Snoq117.2]SEO67657.1 PAS domain S-box-containing protein/diguanylate cyclase (GGDEF) domain-containing protein [Pseudomonas sp. Snoq117.2]